MSDEVPVAECTVCGSQLDTGTKMFRTADILFDVGIGSSGSKVLSQLYCTVAFVVFPACKK